MREPVFLDTSFAIAFLDSSDRYNAAARRWASQLARERPPVLTTEAIFLEIGNNFAKARDWPRAREFILGLRAAPNVEVVALSPELFARGWALRCRREDQSWGLVDCTSFEVMRDAACRAALTSDRHFLQAGFRALLLE